MAHVELGHRERRIIQTLSGQSMRMAGLAQQVSRHRSTICRDLKRNCCRFEAEHELNGCYGSIAHGFAADPGLALREELAKPT
ncbi:hypothetical protein [Poseidonocella sp. HB161398]|uniref:hypothetical protein n=1 Tax=Poseidonocella sp. HB161398 TaxID=2320855 RepID=UPI00110813A2|nr:hypothetical protein [Poseidonocella sp. HB161398]